MRDRRGHHKIFGDTTIMSDNTTDTISVNGIDIAYRFDGPEDAPPLMLSNSLSSALGMWDVQVAALVPAYRVLRYDTRGHGATSAPPGPYDMDMLTADVIGLLDALEIERTAYCGLSMGGMIGQQLGLEHPDRFTGLVLADTTSQWPDGAGVLWSGRIRAAQTQGMPALAEATLERWFTEPYLASRSPEVERIADYIRSTPAAGFVGCAEAIRRIDYLDRLSAISLPVLIIAGADDPATPVSAAEAMHEKIPGSQLVVIEQAAHLANVEQPEAFNKALLDFLATL
jgi:3-oxoadipate enol-lactonase